LRCSSGCTSARRRTRCSTRGVTLADPDRIDIRGTLTCGADVFIDVGCIFEGNVQLGDGVSIGSSCVLKDARLEEGVQVLPFCHLEGATAGANARIGPYSRLRPGRRSCFRCSRG
jgi:bifunctional UDP-N-acetylglucosamine pyrophosphorylase/glucosamine-1-phosphate N-acetyltransferase